MSMASRESMASSVIIDCSKMSDLVPSLRNLQSDVNVCIIQSITSFLTAAVDTGSVFGTIDPILGEFSARMSEFCAAKPAIQVFVAPPMFRPHPAWYRCAMPEIAHQFSSILTARKPRNLHLLTSPAHQTLVQDGIHLDPVSGLHYVIHLFDDADKILKALGSKGLNFSLRFCYLVMSLLICCIAIDSVMDDLSYIS